MVVKTELCAFSETRIYPGKGRRFVTKGGQMVLLGNSKVRALYHQKLKPAKLTWTQGWRRMHKKLNLEAQAKRRVRRVVKAIRAPVGISQEDLKKKIKKDAPAAAAGAKKEGVVRQAAVKEAKEKAKKDAAARKAQRAAAPKAAPAQKSHGGKGR